MSNRRPDDETLGTEEEAGASAPASSANGGSQVPDDDVSDIGAPATPEEAIFEGLIGMLSVLAPHVPEQKLWQLAEYVLLEQEKLVTEFLPLIGDEEKLKSRPVWGVKLTGPDGGQGHVLGFKHPKLCASDGTLILGHIQVLSLVTSPIVRAVLRAYGFEYSFVEAPADVLQQPSRVIIAH